MKKKYLYIFVVAVFLAMQFAVLHHNYSVEHHDAIEHGQCEICHLGQSFSSMDMPLAEVFDTPPITNNFQIKTGIYVFHKTIVKSYHSQAPPLA